MSESPSGNRRVKKNSLESTGMGKAFRLTWVGNRNKEPEKSYWKSRQDDTRDYTVEKWA